MNLRLPASPILARLGVLAALLGFPAAGLAHGGDKAAVEELSMQPARVLAQQALSTLLVLNDVEDAALRLDAAVESKDKSDIDVAQLRQAMETLDAGKPEDAIPLLDAALSRPLGSDQGKALHEAGREFRPATGAQEIVGIALGVVLMLVGGAALWRIRGRGATLEQP